MTLVILDLVGVLDLADGGCDRISTGEGALLVWERVPLERLEVFFLSFLSSVIICAN